MSWRSPARAKPALTQIAKRRQEEDPAARAGERGPASCRCLPVPGEPAGKIVFPLVREMAAASTRIRVPVAVACRVLGRSTQGYYQWAKNPVSRRDWDDAHLINAALDIHANDPGYGYRFIADDLADVGITASENRVWRLCSAQAILATHHRRRRHSAHPPGLNRSGIKPGMLQCSPGSAGGRTGHSCRWWCRWRRSASCSGLRRRSRRSHCWSW